MAPFIFGHIVLWQALLIKRRPLGRLYQGNGQTVQRLGGAGDIESNDTKQYITIP